MDGRHRVGSCTYACAAGGGGVRPAGGRGVVRVRHEVGVVAGGRAYAVGFRMHHRIEQLDSCRGSMLLQHNE